MPIVYATNADTYVKNIEAKKAMFTVIRDIIICNFEIIPNRN